ncbi:winged helix-turn-helix transcriptional regulator [Barnesiella sp. WM24]|uniref:ATP-binding protein n=1 Tax=Barnesiella sp. WM24 TaxID=2558278 RepID=UPI00107246B8|nr:ATP-binding protein [Barnesiella sp. WM24]TFU91900.1 winged helix-turn-helix transcriptional regulator [Barnesiella sp. WM24]
MNNENQNIEYKRIWKDEYLKWVCGFANAQGGRIYIGIGDDMALIGVSHLHQQLEDIPNKIVTMLGIVPTVSHIVQEGKDIIEIDIDHSNIPISYKGAFYVRSGATNQELRGVALQQFLMKKFGRSWEDMPCYGATMDDIDPEAIKYFLKKGIKEKRMSPDVDSSTPEEVISNLGLMEDGVPCNGAILLFGKYPQRRFITSSFKIGRFGATNFDLLSQEIINGNLIQMPERVLRTLDDKYLIRPIHYRGLQRVEPLEIPEEALREIICNSIVHRDYQGTWTQMSIYSDHIRLWNEGKLPEDLSIEKLMDKHTSKPRNPKMAEAFYRAGFIEAWGRGIEKIVNGFKGEGLTPPTFSVEQGGVTVYIPRERFEAVNLGGTTEINRHQSSEKSSEKGSGKSSEKTRDRIVREMKDNPLVTINELATILSISDRAVSKHIKKLQSDGVIRRVGAARGGYWQVINH